MWLPEGDKPPELVGFRTSDTSLAAYLYFINIRLLGIEIERDRGVFIFEHPAEGAVTHFLSGKAEGSLFIYYRSYKALLRMLSERKAQIASSRSIL